MRSINLSTPNGDMLLEITDELEKHVATRNGIPRSSVTDSMIIGFFREAADVAFQKAAAEYLESDGTNT
jgi:hypothetical protein